MPTRLRIWRQPAATSEGHPHRRSSPLRPLLPFLGNLPDCVGFASVHPHSYGNPTLRCRVAFPDCHCLGFRNSYLPAATPTATVQAGTVHNRPFLHERIASRVTGALGCRYHIPSSPYPLHQPIAQHPQTGISQAPLHAEQGAHLGGREPLGVFLQGVCSGYV